MIYSWMKKFWLYFFLCIIIEGSWVKIHKKECIRRFQSKISKIFDKTARSEHHELIGINTNFFSISSVQNFNLLHVFLPHLLVVQMASTWDHPWHVPYYREIKEGRHSNIEKDNMCIYVKLRSIICIAWLCLQEWTCS